MPRKNYRFLILLASVVLGWSVSVISAQTALSEENPVELTEIVDALIEGGNHNDNVTLMILMERSAEPHIFSAEDPLRLIVDIPNAYANKMLPSRILPQNSLVTTGIRVGEDQGERRVRFVFDLQPGKKYNVTPRLYVSEGKDSAAKLLVTVTPDEPARE